MCGSQELGRFPDQGQFDMETVTPYGVTRTSRQGGLVNDNSVSDGGQSSTAPADSSVAPFVTKPRIDVTSPRAIDEGAASVDEQVPSADEHAVESDTGFRRSQAALDISRDSVTGNLSDVCSEEVAAAQVPNLGQSSAMVRGGEVFGSAEGEKSSHPNAVFSSPRWWNGGIA